MLWGRADVPKLRGLPAAMTTASRPGGAGKGSGNTGKNLLLLPRAGGQGSGTSLHVSAHLSLLPGPSGPYPHTVPWCTQLTPDAFTRGWSTEFLKLHVGKDIACQGNASPPVILGSSLSRPMRNAWQRSRQTPDLLICPPLPSSRRPRTLPAAFFTSSPSVCPEISGWAPCSPPRGSGGALG